MHTIAELTDKLQDALSHSPVGRSLLIDLGEAGAIRAEGLTVTNSAAEAECTLKISKADLDAVLSGDLDLVEAANDGRIEVIGDPSAAIAMQPVLFAAWLND